VILLDTNVFIEILLGTASGKEAVNQIKQAKKEAFGYSTITWFELCVKEEQKADARNLLEHFQTIPLTLRIAEIASEIFNRHLAGNRRKIPDALIAATALEAKSKFWTFNVSDFKKIPKLRLFRPL